MLKILPPKNKGAHYNEIGQQKNTKFAFANKLDDQTYSQIHQEFKCRDFLGDCVYATETQKPWSIYGFSFDPGSEKLDTDATRLVIKDSPKCFFGNFEILWDVETKNNIQRTFFYSSENGYVVEGSPVWQSSAMMISLYSFLFKCMSYDIKDLDNWIEELVAKKDTNESFYLNQVGAEKVKKILSVVSKIPDKSDTSIGYDLAKANSHKVHDYSGWVSLCQNEVPDNTISKRIHALIK